MLVKKLNFAGYKKEDIKAYIEPSYSGLAILTVQANELKYEVYVRKDDSFRLVFNCGLIEVHTESERKEIAIE